MDFAIDFGFQGFDFLLVENAFADQEESKFRERIAVGFFFALGGGFVELFVVGERMRIGARDVRVDQSGAASGAAIVYRRARRWRSFLAARCRRTLRLVSLEIRN